MPLQILIRDLDFYIFLMSWRPSRYWHQDQNQEEDDFDQDMFQDHYYYGQVPVEWAQEQDYDDNMQQDDEYAEQREIEQFQQFQALQQQEEEDRLQLQQQMQQAQFEQEELQNYQWAQQEQQEADMRQQQEWDQDYDYYDDYQSQYEERELFRKLRSDQQKYLRDIKDEARVKYYKQQFKFDQKVKDIYLGMKYLNARELFEILQKTFNKQNIAICQCMIKTYHKKGQVNKQKQYEEKLTRISRQIENILRRDSYHEVQVKMEKQTNYTSIPIQLSKPQFIHVTLKIPRNFDGKHISKLKEAGITFSINRRNKTLKLQNPKWKNKDYLSVSNNSYCNSLKKWDIGCCIKNSESQTYYSYFQPQGEHFVSFSRSMNLSQGEKEQSSQIHEICVYTSFSSSIVLRTVIKKEQIQLLSYSSNKKNVYIFLSSPPLYEFTIMPPNTFCLPNYLNRWERVENFLFLRHKDFKDNDFLRLFLYSNSYIHIELDQRDLQSFKNISMDIKLLQRQLRCNNQILSTKIQHTTKLPPSLQPLSIRYIDKALDFINYKGQPKLTAHTKWKLKYQIMLLVRFNVVGPGEINEILELLQRRCDKLDYLLDFLSCKSSGYTNKVAGLNRFRSRPFEKLKNKIQEYFQEKLSNKSMNYQPRYFQHSCLIYKVSLTPSGILPNPISHQTKCRLIRHYEKQTEFFVKITLLDDVNQTMKNQKYLYNKILRKLLDRIKIMDKEYAPLGWSGSQLRGSSIWYVNQIHQKEGDFQKMTQQSILQFLGDFSEIRVAAKKAARIGQAFSSSFYYNSQDVQQIVEEDDVSKKQFLFTDGIGMISSELFDEISQKFAQDYDISFNCCLQIRYKGAKGVLLLNQQLKGRTIVLRNSMIKYKCNDPAAKKYLDILSWDKYLPGYLNKQTIILLKSLGISDAAFLDLQRKYIKDLNSIDFQDGNLFKIFNDTDSGKDSFSLTISSLFKHFDISKDLFFQQFLESIKENKLIELKTKTRILVEKSARLIGVIDDYEVLEEGELYCCVIKRDNIANQKLNQAIKERSKEEQQQQKMISSKKEKPNVIEGDVIITRNPALSPADVRKRKCISLQQVNRRLKQKGLPFNPFERFINCIVFPKKGPIPLTAQISGSDLDGDIFFICWDERFIVKRHQPCETLDDPNKKKSVYNRQAEYRQMLNFFVEFANNEKLGRISNAFIVHADSSPDFAKNKNCKILAKIHGKAVDYGKSGELPEEIPQDLFIREFPDFMEKWNKPMYQSKSVLGQLYRQSKEEITNHQKNKPKIELRFQGKLIDMLPLGRINRQEIKEVTQQLKRFQQDVTELLNRSSVKNEFQLYTGSSAENKELKNDFGRKRLVDWLQDLKDKYQYQFFWNKRELEIYKKLTNFRSRKTKVFKGQYTQKAILAYVITYFCFCLNEDHGAANKQSDEVKKLLMIIQQVKNQHNYEGLYLGYVWLIVPKIMIYLKSSEFEGNQK